MDDDTFVYTRHLRFILSRLEPSAPLYLGALRPTLVTAASPLCSRHVSAERLPQVTLARAAKRAAWASLILHAAVAGLCCRRAR